MTTTLAAAAAVALSPSCSTQQVDLTPVDVARTDPSGGEVAAAEVAGVRLEVASDAWDGGLAVTRRATPLQVSLDNRSGHRLRIRYDQFALVAGDGTRYSALPPFLADPAPGGVRPLPSELRFRYVHFMPAPYLTAYYPFLTPFRSPLHADPLYYRHYYYGDRDGLGPTLEEARLWAIPEGVLAVDGELEGFLFFERVPAGGPSRVTFQAELVDPDSGEMFGTVSIPFEVAPEG